jgi:ribosomal protein S8
MNTFNTNLISQINNANISEEKSSLICKKTQFHLILCKCLYEEGLISSFEIQKDNIKIILNNTLTKKKILKYVFSKKTKNTIGKQELSRLKSSFGSLILSGVLGLKSLDYYRKQSKGGVLVYKFS